MFCWVPENLFMAVIGVMAATLRSLLQWNMETTQQSLSPNHILNVEKLEVRQKHDGNKQKIYNVILSAFFSKTENVWEIVLRCLD